MAIAPDEKIPFPKLPTDPQSVQKRVEAMERILGLVRPIK